MEQIKEFFKVFMYGLIALILLVLSFKIMLWLLISFAEATVNIILFVCSIIIVFGLGMTIKAAIELWNTKE